MSQDLENAPPPTIQSQLEPDNCIKILVATDNHIGYAEQDPVRGCDSINTFREILQLAVENDVDMLLLAGDLFHENRPSRTSLYQTMAALREYTQGDRPVTMELVSDAGIGIARTANYPGVNYEDHNINVGLPVFSIHGNHDDPQGTGSEGALCALDLLSSAGLVNYFGRLELPGSATDDASALEDGLSVKPVLLQKGETKLALYGMGNIKDERFHAEMKFGRIRMFRPKEERDDWFNILLVHQNRVKHGPNNYISDQAFGEDADLIIWGHEHDCIEEAGAVPVTGKKYRICQPGSSIATSLAAGEAIPKHVSLLKIQGKEYEMEPIRLRSVRPFIFDTVELREAMDDEENDIDLSTKVGVNTFLKKRVNELIKRANDEWDELHPGEDVKERLLPLIRLKVDYTNDPNEKPFEIGNPQRFGQDFVDKVANPKDIVAFNRKANGLRRKKVDIDQPDLEGDEDGVDGAPEQTERIQVAHLVRQYLGAQNLGVLPENVMENAIDDFVDKGDKDALAHALKRSLLHERFVIGQSFEPSKDGPDHDDMLEEMEAAKQNAAEKFGAKNKKGKGKSKENDFEDDEDDEDGSEAQKEQDSDRDSMASSVASSVKGKGKKKAAPAKKAPAKTTAKKKQQLFNSDSDDSDSEEVEVAPAKKAPAKKAAPAKAAPAKKPAARNAKATAKKVVELSSDESSSESEEEVVAPKKKRK